MTLLVRTPPPRSTESLMGFVLRVAEANGYESPRYIWDLAQVPRGAELAPRFPVEGLAEILGQDPENLRRIAYRARSEGRGSFKILEHSLGDDLRGDILRLRKPAFCPLCVADQGDIDAFWDLGVAVACPVHHCAALSACPACGSPLTWLRPGLLVCHCGGPLTTARIESTDDALCELMAYLQARLHGSPFDSAQSHAGFPIEFLSAVPFSALIRMLAVLGAQALKARRLEATSSVSAVAEAASTLADWPHGYHRFLSLLGGRALSEHPESVGLRKQFIGFYNSTFQNRVSSAYTTFLREEFLRFGQQHWGRAVVDNKLFRDRDAATLGRFVSKQELSRRFRIWKPMMNRMIADGSLVTMRIGTGRCSRIVVDLEKSRLPEDSEGTITVRQAAAELGLPVSVLQELRRTGVLATGLRRGHVNSWHRDDVEVFRVRSRALPVTTDHDPGYSCVRLGDLMRLKLRDARAKADIVAAVVDGRLAVRGRENDRPGGLILDRAEVDAFLLYKRRDVEGKSYSMPECAKVTDICPCAVAGAIKMGLLTAQDRGGRVRVSAASVEQFQAEYVPLSVLARKLGSSTPRLLRTCRDEGLSTVAVPRHNHSSSQPLLRRADEQTLIELFKRASQHLNKRRADAVPPRAERVRQYLASLQASDRPLPRWAGRPNKGEIAKACGIDRNAFYTNRTVIQMIEQFDERECAGSPHMDLIQVLRAYLENLRKSKAPLPRWGGRPNKFAIARACGIARDAFYDRPEFLQLLSEYAENETSGRSSIVAVQPRNRRHGRYTVQSDASS